MEGQKVNPLTRCGLTTYPGTKYLFNKPPYNPDKQGLSFAFLPVFS